MNGLAGLSQTEFDRVLERVNDAQALGVALDNKDIKAANAIRRKYGKKEKPEIRSRDARNAKWNFGTPQNMKIRPPDLANHAVLKVPKPRNYVHSDTPEKQQAMTNFTDWFATKKGGEVQNVQAVEFYGKICQSGADFDGVRAIIHVNGGLSQEQKEWNTYAGDYWDKKNFTFRFVSDFDNTDRKDVEKIRRDNREFRMGNTSVHAVNMIGNVPHVRGLKNRIQEEGGTHDSAAVWLKNNPTKHIWDKRGAPQPGGGKPPVVAAGKIDPAAYIKARKYVTSTNSRIANHLALGESESKRMNGRQGINPSWWVKIKSDGEGLMKKDGVMDGQHGIPETEVFNSDFAESIGMSCVPVTTFRVDPQEGRCSIMEKRDGFVTANQAHANYRANHTLYNSKLALKSTSELVVLTTLTGNYDRHINNWMINENTGEVLAIDNGGGMLRCIRDSGSEIEARDRAQRYAASGWRMAGDRPETFLGMDKFKVMQEHVDAAEKFINSPECDEVIARNFDGEDMVKILKKANPSYRQKSNAEVIATVRKYAKIQLEEGLKYLKAHI